MGIDCSLKRIDITIATFRTVLAFRDHFCHKISTRNSKGKKRSFMQPYLVGMQNFVLKNFVRTCLPCRPKQHLGIDGNMNGVERSD